MNASKIAAIVFGLIVVGFTMWDAATRYTLEQIVEGQPFFYVLYVDVFDRLSLSVVWVVVLGLVVVARNLNGMVRTIPTVCWVLLSVATMVFSLVSPLISLANSSNGQHLRTLSTATGSYHLYVQPYLRGQCDIVLVRCQFQCQFVTIVEQPICQGTRSQLELSERDGDVVVSSPFEVIYTLPRTK